MSVYTLVRNRMRSKIDLHGRNLQQQGNSSAKLTPQFFKSDNDLGLYFWELYN
jgi:hypothetical protein